MVHFWGGNALDASQSLLAALRDTFLLEGAPPEAAALLLQQPGVEVVSFLPGQVIYDAAHYRACMGLVLSGQVEVYSALPERRTLLNILGRGRAFGVAAMFQSFGRYPTLVEAGRKCRILFLPQQALETVFAAHAQVMRNYIGFLSGRIFFLNRKIDAYITGRTTARLATYLMDQAEQDESGAYALTLPVGMNKLARMLSMGRASLYRAEQELTDSELIRREGREVRILDMQRLCQWH